MDLTTQSETGFDLSSRRLLGALFDSRDNANKAIEQLRSAGFGDTDLGYVARHDEAEMPRDLAEGPAESALQGALGGSVVGGVLGAILGATVLAIPGVGPVLAAGIFTATATGVGIGAVSGGLLGLLTGMGYSQDEATRLNEGVEAGRVLVTVNAPTRTEEARTILAETGGDLGPQAMAGIGQIDTSGERIELL